MWDVDARVHIYTATALGRGRVAIPTLDHLYPWENTRYSFYRRLSGHQDKSRHEGVESDPYLPYLRRGFCVGKWWICFAGLTEGLVVCRGVVVDLGRKLIFNNEGENFDSPGL